MRKVSCASRKNCSISPVDMIPGHVAPSFASFANLLPPFPLGLGCGFVVCVSSKYVRILLTTSRSVDVLSIFFGTFLSLIMDSRMINSSKYWFIRTRRRCSLSLRPRFREGAESSSLNIELGEGEGERDICWALERLRACFLVVVVVFVAVPEEELARGVAQSLLLLSSDMVTACTEQPPHIYHYNIADAIMHTVCF